MIMIKTYIVMKNRLFMALMFGFLLVGQSLWAGNWKAKHVVLIGLDGWGAYSVEKAEMPNVKRLMAEGSYVKKAFGRAFLECGQLGVDVYGSRTRVAWLYGMGFQGPGVTIESHERSWDFPDGIQSIERGRTRGGDRHDL